MITWGNYEEYMILLADGELSAKDERELRQFVASNPKLQAELAAYEGTRIVPDETMAYVGKEQLLKSVPAKKTIALNQWWLYSATACLLIGAFLFIGRKQSIRNETNSVALDKPTTNVTTQQALPQVDTSNRFVVAAKLQRQNGTLPVRHRTNVHKPTAMKEDIAQTSKQAERDKEIITPIDVAPNQPLAVTTNPPVQRINTISTAKQATTEIEGTSQTTDNRLLAMVPIIQESKNNIMDIKDAVTDRVKQVQDIGKDMKDMNVVLHVGNREIAFNF